MGIAEYYSDVESFDLDIVEWDEDWAYVIDEDIYASEISEIFQGDMAFERLIIRDGAYFYVDIPISIHSIQIGVASENEAGHLILMPVGGIDYNNALITFETYEDSGIWFEKGTFQIDEKEFDHRYVIRSEISSPTYRWSFYASGDADIDDIDLQNLENLEMFHMNPSMIYEKDDQLQSYQFPRGFTNIQPGESWSIRHQSVEKGRGAYSEFEYSEGEIWNVQLKLTRKQGGKRDIALFKWIGSEGQKKMPILFFSQDIVSFARIEDLDYPTDSPMTYGVRMNFREVPSEYEKY